MSDVSASANTPGKDTAPDPLLNEPTPAAPPAPPAKPNTLPAPRRPEVQLSPHAPVPWWFWPLGFLVVFVVDAGLMLILLDHGQDLTVAVGVPGVLTAAALAVLRALANHMRGRD